jgi:hypothetical protein
VHDPPVAGTVEAVQRELSSDGFLLHHLPHADGGVDGPPGPEGAFITCTSWPADANAARHLSSSRPARDTTSTHDHRR